MKIQNHLLLTCELGGTLRVAGIRTSGTAQEAENTTAWASGFSSRILWCTLCLTGVVRSIVDITPGLADLKDNS